MEARLRILGALRIVKGTETRPSFVEPLDAGERCDLRDFDTRMDLAAGEIWSCVEVKLNVGRPIGDLDLNLQV